MKLDGKIALVTGASRGAGRGIALELALAGAEVYITGRSRRGASTTQYDDLTLDHTADIIEDVGGLVHPITCDHTEAYQIRHLFEQIDTEQDHLDILINNVWGGYMGQHGNLDIETVDFTAPFWEQPLWRYDKMFTTAPRAHYIASQEAAKIMIRQENGLIITTTFWDDDKYLSNLPYDLVKTVKNRMVYGMAIELAKYKIATLAISLGWIRTEHLKQLYDLDDYNYRDKEGFETTESTRYVGRGIVHLAADEDVMQHSGKIMTTSELADLYDFTDLDGTKPAYFEIPDTSGDITRR